MSEHDATCAFHGCNEAASLVITFKGERYFICKKHFQLLQEIIYKLAMQNGEASLDQILEVNNNNNLKIKEIRISEGKVKRGERKAEKYLVTLKKATKKRKRRRKRRKRSK